MLSQHWRRYGVPRVQIPGSGGESPAIPDDGTLDLPELGGEAPEQTLKESLKRQTSPLKATTGPCQMQDMGKETE